MKGKLLVVHGGGPTAVLNASLYGIIKGVKKSEIIQEVYGAIGGVGAIFSKRFADLLVDESELERLLNTPATAIGSSRYPLYEDDYKKLAEILSNLGFGYVILSGGNGTMDTCRQLHIACKDKGILVIGVPKTMDNDLLGIDHSPGFSSAAKYIATATAEVIQDVKSLPIHVCIIEAMGRNAGWVTAASGLAHPDLIYLPERAFNEKEFLDTVKKKWDNKKGLVIVVSEGLVDEDKKSIVEPIFQTERAIYYGDVGTYLATLIIKELGIKARAEKPGLIGRCSMRLRSKVDIKEAIEVGEYSIRALEQGKSGYMVGLRRKDCIGYSVEYPLINLETFDLSERIVPDEFITEDGTGVTEKFLEWLRPLVGELDIDFYDFL